MGRYVGGAFGGQTDSVCGISSDVRAKGGIYTLWEQYYARSQTAWKGSVILASGGTITNTPTGTCHTFTGPGTWNLPSGNGPLACKILIIGGGGSGGARGGNDGSGGGGAAELNYQTTTLSP